MYSHITEVNVFSILFAKFYQHMTHTHKVLRIYRYSREFPYVFPHVYFSVGGIYSVYCKILLRG